MRVLIISQYFYPENFRVNELAEYLSEKKEITPCFVINKFLREIKDEFIIKKVSNSQIFIKKIN